MWHRPVGNAIRGFNDAASLYPAAIRQRQGTRVLLIYNALPPAGTLARRPFNGSRTLQHDQEQSSLFGGGILWAIIIVIVVAVFYQFATKLHHFTHTVHDREYEVHDTVADRIRPFGRVKLPGEEHGPDELRVDEVPQAEPHATTMSGPQVFNEACIVCHGNGIGGAPMLNDRSIWESRIAQGMETLYRHAIEGYTGSAGYMPPKGARMDLSDSEVNAAVDYMLSQLPN